MRSMGFGLNAVSCLSTTAIVIAGFAFIDDTDILHVAPSVRSRGEDVHAAMHDVLRTWEGILRVTGGALRGDKSCWYLLDCVHVDGG